MDLPVEISWLNNSDQTFNNLKIKITATAGALDVKATAKANNLKIESGNLIIDSSARTALAGGKPGASDKFTVNLKLLSTLALGQVENAYLEITPAVVAQLSEVPGQNFEPLGNPAKIPLASELKLKAEARYYTPKATSWAVGPCPRAWDKPQNIGFLYKLTILPTPLTALNFLPPCPRASVLPANKA